MTTGTAGRAILILLSGATPRVIGEFILLV
ncbi:hypothetical protein HNP00_001210 [Arthrobacter sp. AZCC_0090]|nr:hypothetical protein [Arthrobacter sp. AZCC_0090]